MPNADNPTLVYIGDVMCSWCWGFAPELESIVDRSNLPTRVMVGGLRPGPSAESMTPALAAFLDHHWTQIEQLTGQPFDRSVFGWKNWRYDTELPAMAVVTMRALAPQQTLLFFNRLQRAFYGEAIDITDPSVYGDLLAGFDVDPASFLDRFTTEEIRAAAWRDFSTARSLGISGFPTLLLHDGPYRRIAAGYRPAADIERTLSELGYTTDASACGIGDIC